MPSLLASHRYNYSSVEQNSTNGLLVEYTDSSFINLLKATDDVHVVALSQRRFEQKVFTTLEIE
jgi:hypothetical protein